MDVRKASRVLLEDAQEIVNQRLIEENRKLRRKKGIIMNRPRPESFSSINLFLRCPLAYKRRYIDKKKQNSSPAMERGKNIHLEISDPNRVEQTDQAKFAKKFYKETGRGCVNVARPGEITSNMFEAKLGLRKEKNIFTFCSFSHPQCWFRGIADMITLYYKKEDQGAGVVIDRVRVIDWKTGKSTGDKRQLLIYSWIVSLLLGVTRLEAQFVYLDKEKVSKVYKFSQKDFEDIQAWLVEKIDQIRAEKELPAKEHHFCDFCENLETCPLKKEISKDTDFLRGLLDLK